MGISIEEYKKMIKPDKKNPKRQIQGSINHLLGESFENRISDICKYYEIEGIAKIEKTPEPMKVLKHVENGHFEAIFTKSAQPDFKGCKKGGQTIVFDAKFTESDRIRYPVLSDNQRETLVNYKDLGADSFVLVGFSDSKIYKIGIDKWNNMKEEFGRKYILQQELEDKGFEVKKNKKGIIDFIGE